MSAAIFACCLALILWPGLKKRLGRGDQYGVRVTDRVTTPNAPRCPWARPLMPYFGSADSPEAPEHQQPFWASAGLQFPRKGGPPGLGPRRIPVFRQTKMKRDSRVAKCVPLHADGDGWHCRA